MSTIVPSYEGSKKDTRLRHGQGRYTYQYAGFCYEGDWNEGVKQGTGTMYLPDGSIFEGDFVEGEMTGFGKRTYPNGASYEGDFFRGEHHGKGLYKYADGSVYDGNWHEKQRYGKGTLTFANGDVFDGTFKKHHFHGLSKFTSSDGTVFEGDFENGKRNGHGIEMGANGSKYDGGWKENKKSGIGVFEGVGQVCYEGPFEDGKALDASEYVDFDNTAATSTNTATTNRIIGGKGVTLPPIAVTCYCKNRDKPQMPLSEEGQESIAMVKHQPNHDLVKKHNETSSRPTSKETSSRPTSKDNQRKGTGKENPSGVSDPNSSHHSSIETEEVASHLRAIKESGRLLRLTVKPIKFKDAKLNEDEALLKQNVDLFLTRGTIGDAATGKLPPAIPRLVKHASKLVPDTLSLDYMLGTVKPRHPSGALAKYQFPPTRDLERAQDEHRAGLAHRKEADSEVQLAAQSIGDAAAQAYMKAAVAKAKADKVQLDMEEAQLLAEQASVKAVAHTLKKKSRFALAGKAVASDVLKSRRLFALGQTDPRFMEKSVEMVLEEDGDNDEDGENNGRSEEEDGSSEEGRRNRESGEGETGNGAMEEDQESCGELGGVTCRMMEPNTGCWTGGLILEPKVTKFADAVHATFAAKTPNGKAAAAGALSLCFDFFLTPPTSATDLQTNKPFNVTLLSSDILTIKLTSEPRLSAEDLIVAAKNNRSKKRGSVAAMARADKQAKLKIERTKLVTVKLVVTLTGVGDVETVVFHADQIDTRLPPPPAPDATEVAQRAATACTRYETPPDWGSMLPQVGGSLFGAWHSLCLVFNPKSLASSLSAASIASSTNADTNSVLASLFTKNDMSYRDSLSLNNESGSQSNGPYSQPQNLVAKEAYLDVCLDGYQLSALNISNVSWAGSGGGASNNSVDSAAPPSPASSVNKSSLQFDSVANQSLSISDQNVKGLGVLLREDFKWCLSECGGLKKSPCAFTFMESRSAPFGSGLSSFVVYDLVLDTRQASQVSGCYAGFRALEIAAAQDCGSQVESSLDEWRKEHPPKDPEVVKQELAAKRERALERLEAKKAAEEALALKKGSKAAAAAALAKSKKEEELKKKKELKEKEKKERESSGIGEHEEEDGEYDGDNLDGHGKKEEEEEEEEDELELSEDEAIEFEPPLLPEIMVGSTPFHSKDAITYRGTTVFRGVCLPRSIKAGEYKLRISDVSFEKLDRKMLRGLDTCGGLLRPLPPISMTMVVPDSE